MRSAEPGVAAALEATGVARIVDDDSTLGWGLANHSTTRLVNYDWRRRLPLVIAQYHPELVIAMWSWDDDVAKSDPTAYLQTLDQALSLLLTPGNGVDGVVLLRFPQLAPPPASLALYRSTGWTSQSSVAGVEAARKAWNALAAQAAAGRPSQVLFSNASTVVDSAGRAVDRVHLCPSGAALLGQAVTDELAQVLSLPPPRSGWQAGVAGDPRYEVQPGLCPAGR